MAQGAEAFLWPIGGTGTYAAMDSQAKTIGAMFGVPVFATQGYQAVCGEMPSSILVKSDGSEFVGISTYPIETVSLKSTFGYTGTPYLRAAKI